MSFPKKSILVVAGLIMAISFVVPRAQAQIGGINFIGTIIRIAGYIRNIWNVSGTRFGTAIPANIPHVFPFGGRITRVTGGCQIRFWIWYSGPPLYVPIPCPNCGRIPLASTGIVVGSPVPGPGEMFTFPFITDIYANHRQGRAGVWTLGIGFTPFPIDQINRALQNIRFSIGVFTFDNFNLRCSDDNRDVILKIGTS